MTSPPYDVSLPETHEYSPEERSQLLSLAHAAIQAAIQNITIGTDAPSEHLSEPRGAFTTLHIGGKLRGCVGYVIPVYSLYRTVAETAQAAAFHDGRFEPVAPEEVPHLQIEISVLSRLKPISPEEIKVGRHGLVVSKGAYKGLLLPQVPLEWGWDRETFLSQTCRKAGLPLDAWKTGATIEAFTAEVFSDPEPTGVVDLS